MNNLTKSVKVISDVVALVMGSNFATPGERVMMEYPYTKYFH
jgi:hypothetical protein